MNEREWPWIVRHKGHPAWYLRAFLPADFQAGAPIDNYAATLDGRLEDQPLRCGSCGETIADANVLSVVHRGAPTVDTLEAYRKGARAGWGIKTNRGNCWHCNYAMREPVIIHKSRIAAAYGLQYTGSATVRVCKLCAEYIDARER